MRYNYPTFFIILLMLFSQSAFSEDHALEYKEQCEAWGINYTQVKIFAKSIQDAVRKDDKDALADFVSYPLTVYRWKKSDLIINNKNQFIEKYNIIFNNKIKAFLLKPNSNDFICNYHGVGMAGGVIWFSGDSFKFFQMNMW